MRRMVGVVSLVLLVFPRMSEAQTAAGPEASRVFVDVNLIGSTSSDAKPRVFTGRFVVSGEVGTSRADYPKPSRETLLPMIDVGGGYMAGRSVGLGMGLSRASFDDVVDLSATIPHPTFLNASASGTGVTDRALSRKETALHVFVAAVPLRTRRAQVRIFGGPSFFWLKADLVQSVLYDQASNPATPQNSVTITGFESQQSSGSGVGWHAGSDFTYFFKKRVGVSGGARYSQANVTVKKEPMSKLNQEIRVGGLLVFLGVRFRFGE